MIVNAFDELQKQFLLMQLQQVAALNYAEKQKWKVTYTEAPQVGLQEEAPQLSWFALLKWTDC